MRFGLWIPNPYHYKQEMSKIKSREFFRYKRSFTRLLANFLAESFQTRREWMGYYIQSTSRKKKKSVLLQSTSWIHGEESLSSWGDVLIIPQVLIRGSSCVFQSFTSPGLCWNVIVPTPCLVAVCIASSSEPKSHGSKTWLHPPQHWPEFKFPARTAHAVNHLTQKVEMRKSQ